jgi:hypothetical protein
VSSLDLLEQRQPFASHVARGSSPRMWPAVERVIDAWPDDGVRDRILAEVDEQLMPLVHELEEKLQTYLARTKLVER